MFNKPLGEIKNRWISSMIEKLMAFNYKFHHIPGVENKIADCLSRLTRRIREAEHFSLNEPMLGSYANVKKVTIKSPVECDDPWVQDLAVSAMTDADYMVMVSHIELGTEVDEMPQECELSKLSSFHKELSTLIILTAFAYKFGVPSEQGTVFKISYRRPLSPATELSSRGWHQLLSGPNF